MYDLTIACYYMGYRLDKINVQDGGRSFPLGSHS
jgi:hypothetical protein